jgi:tRNA pseudouridine38-40 synthase
MMVIQKTRYFIFLSYKGTSYYGWQIQPHQITVQKVLDDSLSLILGEDIKTTGAGRTDTGVHASFFCAHFDSEKPDLEDDSKFVFRMNRFLPDDISLISLSRVVPDAHARFSAVSRTYRYFISTVKDPFACETSWHIFGKIDTEKMNEASRVLVNYTDFSSFSKLHSGNRTNICRILDAGWTFEGNYLVFKIKADRFLRNMVRAIVGTIVEIGFGKMQISEFEELIRDGDRSRVGQSAPARGLFLSDIEYPDEIFIRTRSD